jgi:hypothetical protein
LKRLLLLLALLPLLAEGETTTGGVSWLEDEAGAEQLDYTKPQFYPITVPTESGVSNKYYVDMTSGGGSTCSSGSPCANVSDVSGKAGTSGGPVYIYLKGNGRLNLTSSQLAGSVGNEIVVKPWPSDSTPAVMTASGSCGTGAANTIAGANTNNIIFDGGPDGLFEFRGAASCGDQNSYTLITKSNNLTLYRVRLNPNGAGGPALGPANGNGTSQSNFKLINSEIHNAGEYYGVYTGGGATCNVESSSHTDMEFRNNVFRQIDGRGIQIEPRSNSSGVIVDGNAFHDVGYNRSGNSSISGAVQPANACGGNISGMVVSNNIMWDLGGGGVLAFGGAPTDADLKVYNNTIYDYGNQTPAILNSHGITAYDSSGNNGDIQANIVWGSAQPGTVLPLNRTGQFSMNDNLCGSSTTNCGTNAVTDASGTPFQSTDPDSPNFLKLASGESAIAGATNLGLTTDYFGNSRPQGGTYDIGASEFPAGGGSDDVPNSFSFTDQTSVALSTVTASNTLTVSGIDTASAISVTGGEYRINGGSYTSTSGTINNGDTFQVRHTSSASFSTATNTVLTIGGVSDTFTTTTLAADSTPNAFTFTDQTNVALSTTITSAAITVLGINTSSAISVTGGTYSINGGAYTSSSGSVVLNDSVTVRHTSSGSFSAGTDTVLTIGGVSDTFTSTTLAADTTPNAFTFTDQTDVPISRSILSSAITVLGINTSTAISVTGGVYSINGGSFTSTSGSVVLNDVVVARQDSSPSHSTATNAVVTIGGVSDTFTITTLATPTYVPAVSSASGKWFD